jgi:hypothetical protein
MPPRALGGVDGKGERQRRRCAWVALRGISLQCQCRKVPCRHPESLTGRRSAGCVVGLCAPTIPGLPPEDPAPSPTPNSRPSSNVDPPPKACAILTVYLCRLASAQPPLQFHVSSFVPFDVKHGDIDTILTVHAHSSASFLPTHSRRDKATCLSLLIHRGEHGEHGDMFGVP